MNRIEAMKLIGKPVYATTALNGEYIGICKEIITPKGSPWRANVEIKAVTDYPVIGFGQGGVYKCRRPFEEGRVINVGNCSVELLKDDETIPNYEDSVGKALDAGIKTLEEHVEHDKQLGKKDRLIIKWLEVLKERKSEAKLTQMKDKMRTHVRLAVAEKLGTFSQGYYQCNCFAVYLRLSGHKGIVGQAAKQILSEHVWDDCPDPRCPECSDTLYSEIQKWRELI